LTSALDGRAAVVTGAGRGIGRGIARELADAGARVAVVDIDEANASDTAAVIAKTGAEAVAVACDVSDRVSVDAMVATALARFGSLSILVNNAQALRPEVPLIDHTTADLALDSGLWGTFHCMQAACEALRDSGDGRVVNLGSSAGTQGRAGLAGYAATKEAIRGLSRVAAREWGEFGITVNVICPSAMSPGA
jgi:2-hydroxycyclohexanecarboxyl-CoA dehydrogenase